MRLPRTNVLQADDVYVLQSVGPSQPWRFPAHHHDGWSEVQFVIEGRLRQQVNGRDEDLSAGDLLLIRRDDEHALQGRDFVLFNLAIPDREWQRLGQYLGDASLLTALLAQPHPPRMRVQGAERVRLEAEFRQLFTAQLITVQHTPQARLLIARLLLQILPRMRADGPLTMQSRSITGTPGWLRRLVDDLDSLVEEGADPATLAARAGISPEHLARSVRRHLGMTPTTMLNQRRLERAALLLSHSDRSVLAIALDLGFGSASAFSRAFRAHHDFSPREWRQRHGVGWRS
jgi:AraC family transcriptional regulator, dual regulator of chb operon